MNSNPAAPSFIKNYTATYGQLGAYSASGYDCTNILIQAIKAALANGAHTPLDSSDAAGAKTFRQAVIDAMAKTDYIGLTGHHTFDANGDTTNNIITIYQLASVNGQPNWRYVAKMTVQ